MKIIFTLIIVSLTYINCFGQTDLKIFTKDTTRHIIKGANIIYVKNSDFKKVCTSLLDAGFIIDKKDNELETVQTMEPKNDCWVPVLSVRIKDGITSIRPKIFLSTIDTGMDGAYYENGSGKPRSNAIVHAFLQAYKVAKLIGGEIECKKENL